MHAYLFDFCSCVPDSQREISRELLPSIKDKMQDAYEAAVGVERGSGRFERMKNAMASSSQVAVRMMFDDARALLLDGVKEMVNKLKEMISNTVDAISKAIESVFSIMWDSSKMNAKELLDPAVMKKMREVRNALLPGKLHGVGVYANSFCSRQYLTSNALFCRS